jgi:lipopolysaccharide export system protein LptA
VKRSVKAWMVKKSAPPPAPRDVTQLLSGITFSKMDGPRTIFTVKASKSTDFKDHNASLLEDVKITIFGKAGQRHDTIHTKSCQYGKENVGISCSGDVQIDLQSRLNAELAAKDPALARTVHVETRGVKFDRASGAAQTDQPVKFVFPSGSGQAVGVEYLSEEGTLRLLRNVELKFRQLSGKTREKTYKTLEETEEVQVTGTSLTFGKDSRTIQILGPAEAATSTAQLKAGEFTLEMDPSFRAQRLFATAGSRSLRPELNARSARGEMSMNADKLTAQVAPEGWVTRLEAEGTLLGSWHSKEEQDDFTAQAASLELWPRVSQAKVLNLSGGVSVKARMAKDNEARTLQTDALRLQFSEPGEEEGSKPLNAETLAVGTLEWADTPAQANGEPTRTKAKADKLSLEFGTDGKTKQIQLQGNVQTERVLSGRPVQTLTAERGVAQLLASGGWSQMDFQRNVKLAEGEGNAQADHATFAREAQTVTLSDNAVVRDASTETQAARITFLQTTGDIRAEGGVRSTDLSAKGGTLQLAPAPANITSDSMQANSKTGRALYTGHARLWQGNSVLEANSVELLREAKVLNAAGKVRAVFPQTPQTPAGALAPASKKMNLWHIAAERFTYNEPENRAHLEKNVVIQSAEHRIRAPIVDLYFTRGGQSSSSSQNAGTTGNPPAQQISRAVGRGGVVVEQGGRRATAERGEYTASDGRFVMSGGNPTLFDGSQGTTTGLQLTFFLADDTIIVDSGNGSRTLTKHRVEK